MSKNKNAVANAKPETLPMLTLDEYVADCIEAANLQGEAAEAALTLYAESESESERMAVLAALHEAAHDYAHNARKAALAAQNERASKRAAALAAIAGAPKAIAGASEVGKRLSCLPQGTATRAATINAIIVEAYKAGSLKSLTIKRLAGETLARCDKPLTLTDASINAHLASLKRKGLHVKCSSLGTAVNLA